MKLPAGLSASSEVGTTWVAMMGDQSLCKARGEANTGKVFSGRQCERRAGDLLVQASGAVRLVGTQRLIADSCQLVGAWAGRLVVVRAWLHAQGPLWSA